MSSKINSISIDRLRVAAIDKILKLDRRELCNLIDLNESDLLDDGVFKRFKEWVEMKGRFHASKELGHGTTRHIERWLKNGFIPDKNNLIITRILKQEGVS